MQFTTSFKDYDIQRLTKEIDMLGESAEAEQLVSTFGILSQPAFGAALLNTSFFDSDEKEQVREFLSSRSWSEFVNPMTLESWANSFDANLNEGLMDKLKQLKSNVQSKVLKLWGNTEKFVESIAATLKNTIQQLIAKIQGSAKLLAKKTAASAAVILKDLDKTQLKTEGEWYGELSKYLVHNILGAYVKIIGALYKDGAKESLIPALEQHGDAFLSMLNEQEVAPSADAATAYVQQLNDKVKGSGLMGKLKSLKELVVKVWTLFKGFTEKVTGKVDEAIIGACNAGLNGIAKMISSMNSGPQPPQAGFKVSGQLINITGQVILAEVSPVSAWSGDWKKLALTGGKMLATMLVSNVLPGTSIVEYAYKAIKYSLTVQHALHILNGHHGEHGEHAQPEAAQAPPAAAPSKPNLVKTPAPTVN